MELFGVMQVHLYTYRLAAMLLRQCEIKHSNKNDLDMASKVQAMLSGINGWICVLQAMNLELQVVRFQSRMVLRCTPFLCEVVSAGKRQVLHHEYLRNHPR